MFLAKQSSDRHERWVSANASFFRMHRILDIFFVGGFGTVYPPRPCCDVLCYALHGPA